MVGGVGRGSGEGEGVGGGSWEGMRGVVVVEQL